MVISQSVEIESSTQSYDWEPSLHNIRSNQKVASLMNSANQCNTFILLTLTVLFKTYISLPGKGREGHICPTIVMSWWPHCDVI